MEKGGLFGPFALLAFAIWHPTRPHPLDSRTRPSVSLLSVDYQN